ncbi:hypothetical protein [Sphaerimonospora thailandensis]|uniref:Helix-turn-helix protein n=1 Tax=Sphaerimonospora thailandensis TaxID=795644 RepID=A0A8J3REK6_9ACTN|nr:hypothetical protein [Sphaerimonospora thailandensis]GIH73568.1 hypothetical protein Mth01_58210 [Sphaerimonospora thailandensis]
MPSQRATPGQPPAPLSDRIRDYVADKQISIRMLALRSVSTATGQCLTAQWITDVLSGRVSRMPDLWRLEALAAGLGMDPDSVKALAVTQWIGWDIADVQTGVGERLIFRVPKGYTSEQRARLAEEITQMIDAVQADTERDET